MSHKKKNFFLETDPLMVIKILMHYNILVFCVAVFANISCVAIKTWLSLAYENENSNSLNSSRT